MYINELNTEEAIHQSFFTNFHNEPFVSIALSMASHLPICLSVLVRLLGLLIMHMVSCFMAITYPSSVATYITYSIAVIL